MAQGIEVSININEEKNGIELKFSEKPDLQVIDKLKEMNFRWHNQKKIWYATQTTERLEFADSLKQELTPEISEEDIEDVKITEEEITAALTRGSGVSQGKFRIHEQFEKKLSAAQNIEFLKNEYGWGGCSSIAKYHNISEEHNGKGITLTKKTQHGNDSVLLKWAEVEKRIKELISKDKYLNEAEKAYYPDYLEEQRLKEERADIARKFKGIINDFNDYMQETGNNDKLLNRYALSDCASQFMLGNNTSYALVRGGSSIIPLMCDAMNTIIEADTHLTGRSTEMLQLLQDSDIAGVVEKYKELNSAVERYNRMMESSCIRVAESDIDPEAMYNIKYLLMDEDLGRYGIKDEKMQGAVFLEKIRNDNISVLNYLADNVKEITNAASLNSLIEGAEGRHNKITVPNDKQTVREGDREK